MTRVRGRARHLGDRRRPDLRQGPQAGRRPHRRRPDGGRRGVRLADRPERLRQEHAAEAGRRPRQPDVGGRQGLRQGCPAGAARPGLRDRLPAGGPAPVAHGHRQHRAAAQAPRRRLDAAQGPGRRADRAGGTHRLREEPPRPALGRHAAAGRDRPRTGREPAAAADGRAVRRARRDHPRADAERAGAHLRRDRCRRPLRDPLDPRGRLPLRPGRRDVPASGPDHRRRRRPGRRPGRCARPHRAGPRRRGLLPRGGRRQRPAARHPGRDRRCRRDWSEYDGRRRHHRLPRHPTAVPDHRGPVEHRPGAAGVRRAGDPRRGSCSSTRPRSSRSSSRRPARSGSRSPPTPRTSSTARRSPGATH